MSNKNFEVKHGLSVGGTDRIASAGVITLTDLNVTGTTTTIDTATLQVQDKNIVINYGTGDTSSTASGAGITIQDAVDASNDATLLWDNSNDEFDFSHTVTAPSLTIAGAATFDGTTLAVDATNNRVGIGTTSPNAALHLGFNQNNVGSSANPAIQIGGTSNYRLGLYTDAEGGIIQNLNGDDGLQFRVKTKGEAMRIDGGTGNVLIGNTSGSGILNVDNGTTNGGYVHFANNVGSTTLTNDKGLAFGWNKSNGGGESLIIGNQGAGSTGGLRFATNNSDGSAYAERMVIGNTGKTSWSAAGIGTVTTQDRDFTFYTEGSTNGVDIRSNDYRNILLGAGGSSGAAMDAGYIGIYKDGSTKIALNANGDSYIDGGEFGIGTGGTNDRLFHVKGAAVSTVAKFANTGSIVYVELNADNQAGADAGYLAYNSSKVMSLWTDDTQQMSINSSGDVHFNHLSNDFRLRGGVYGSLFDSSPNMNHNIRFHSSAGMYFNTGTTNGQFIFEQRGTGRFTIDSSGGSPSSDRKLKENIEDITYGLDTVKQLQPRKFDWKGEDIPADEKASIGFIAQEVESLIPEVVNETIHPDDPGDGSRNIKRLNYSAMTSVLVKAIQELEARVKELEG